MKYDCIPRRKFPCHRPPPFHSFGSGTVAIIYGQCKSQKIFSAYSASREGVGKSHNFLGPEIPGILAGHPSGTIAIRLKRFAIPRSRHPSRDPLGSQAKWLGRQSSKRPEDLSMLKTFSFWAVGTA